MGHCPRASVQGETSAFCRNEPRRIDPNRVGCLETKASRGCMRSLVDRGCQKTMGFWRMLPAAIVCSSSGSRSVRDRSRVRRAGCLGRSFAFWRRRTTAGAAAADPRSRPIRAPECKRRRQHSCMGHAEPAQRVWQRLVAFRLSPSRFGPRRVAPGRPGSTFWARVRSAHAGRPPRSARKPASRTGRRARPGNSRSTALGLVLNFTRRNIRVAPRDGFAYRGTESNGPCVFWRGFMRI